MYRRFQNRRTVRAEFATEWMVIQRVAGTVEKQIKLLPLTSNIVIMKIVRLKLHLRIGNGSIGVKT